MNTKAKNMKKDIKILVSACLYGQATAYDGKSRTLTNDTFLRWKSDGILIPVCAEVLGGLPTPRCPSEILGDRVITKDGADVTENFVNGAAEVLRTAQEHSVKLAILKDGSPSCGCRKVYDGTFGGIKINGMGVCAKLLTENGVKVFTADEVEDAALYLKNLQGDKSDE